MKEKKQFIRRTGKNFSAKDKRKETVPLGPEHHFQKRKKKTKKTEKKNMQWKEQHENYVNNLSSSPLSRSHTGKHNYKLILGMFWRRMTSDQYNFRWKRNNTLV